jgi:G3E family GTPase
MAKRKNRKGTTKVATATAEVRPVISNTSASASDSDSALASAPKMPKSKNLKGNTKGSRDVHAHAHALASNNTRAVTKQSKPLDKRIPVTILSGFLGSGKTSTLQYILKSHKHKKRVAVIVNDMAELNIDAAIVVSGGQHESGGGNKKKDVIALSNGCICCSLRGDLVREIARIQKLGTFDYILIESTGIAEPQQVAESFCADPETQHLAKDPSKMLWNIARLDTCVTVLDVQEFPRLLSTLKRFKDCFKDGLEDDDPNEEGDKSIVELLIEQVEFANVILLNKTDLVSEEQLTQVRRQVESLNPKAKIISTQYGVVHDLNFILDTNLFSLEEAEQSSGWLVSLQKANEGIIETESDEYGISSFVYRARKPFHPTRLALWVKRIFHFAEEWDQEKTTQDEEEQQRLATMQTDYGTIFRSKGYCWIAGRDQHMGGWAQSGRILLVHPMQSWYADLPEDQWDVTTPEEIKEIRINFEGSFGDRRQAIVFIGTDLKQDALVAALDSCLLTDTELKRHALSDIAQYHDTLPEWKTTYETANSQFNPTLRPEQKHQFVVVDGLMLEIQNLALEYEPEATGTSSFAVKVWLERGEGNSKVSRLLATLRPGSCEQYSTSIQVIAAPSDGKDTSNPGSVHRLRMEPIGPYTPNLSSVQVHVLGVVTNAPWHEANDEGEEEVDEDDGGGDCDGDCDEEGHDEEGHDEEDGEEEHVEDGRLTKIRKIGVLSRVRT